MQQAQNSARTHMHDREIKFKCHASEDFIEPRCTLKPLIYVVHMCEHGWNPALRPAICNHTCINII